MLTQQQLAIIKAILFSKLDPKKHTVFIFGSRATGASEKYSDLDIGVEGQQLTATTHIELEEAFEESDLPFRVDVVDFSTVNDKFKQVAKQKILAI